jgi:hypothetical protein
MASTGLVKLKRVADLPEKNFLHLAIDENDPRR